MQRKDFRFDKLLAGDYAPKPDKGGMKKIVEKEQQMSLFPMLEEQPSDEGEFIKSYVADYRRIHEYGE